MVLMELKSVTFKLTCHDILHYLPFLNIFFSRYYLYRHLLTLTCYESFSIIFELLNYAS